MTLYDFCYLTFPWVFKIWLRMEVFGRALSICLSLRSIHVSSQLIWLLRLPLVTLMVLLTSVRVHVVL